MQMRTSLTILPVLLGVFALACSSSAERVGSSSAAVGGFPGCSGSFNTQPSPSGAYYATDFGCSSNPYFTDPGDACGSAACIQSAYEEGVCSSSQSNADCQRAVNWYSVGGASYGCGARLQVTNPANGKSVVVMVLDNGPSCTVENDADFWVLDVSYPTIMYLFGSEEGYSDHARIQVAVVGSSTPLGPTAGGGGGTTTADAGYGSCTANGESGQCIDTSACSAQGGTSTAGECPGPDDIQCCTGTSSAGGSSGGSSSSSSSSGSSSSGSSSGSSGAGGASCSTDGDCNPGTDGSGLICVGGTCTPGCNADWECSGNTTCVSGTCQ